MSVIIKIHHVVDLAGINTEGDERTSTRKASTMSFRSVLLLTVATACVASVSGWALGRPSFSPRLVAAGSPNVAIKTSGALRARGGVRMSSATTSEEIIPREASNQRANHHHLRRHYHHHHHHQRRFRRRA